MLSEYGLSVHEHPDSLKHVFILVESLAVRHHKHCVIGEQIGYGCSVPCLQELLFLFKEINDHVVCDPGLCPQRKRREKTNHEYCETHIHLPAAMLKTSSYHSGYHQKGCRDSHCCIYGDCCRRRNDAFHNLARLSGKGHCDSVRLIQFLEWQFPFHIIQSAIDFFGKR